MKRSFLFCILGSLFAACSGSHEFRVSVGNPSQENAVEDIVEIPLSDIRQAVSAPYLYVVDNDGNEIPSQQSYDGKLLFMASVDAGSKETYRVLPSDTVHEYPAVVTGRIHPERADDLAWENDKVGFRAYGPATQRAGERAYGYDIFFKYRSDRPVLDDLYAIQTSAENWAKVDSVRKVNPAGVQDFINTFTYHVDHGQGMDCYAVGPTAGDGMSVIMENDSLLFAWCYDKAQVLEYGPLRFSARLDFAPRAVGADTAVVEHRIISLDRGSQLNHARVWFDGLSEKKTVAIGFPLRDESEPVVEDTYVAYADPTQGPDNGKALLGAVVTGGFDGNASIEKHVLGLKDYAPGDTLEYYWGFAWDRQGMDNINNWSQYLDRFSKTKAAPLTVEY